MIRAIGQDDVEQCVKVIQEAFGTVAEEFGITPENAPRFTAFATTVDRINWHLNGEHRPMYGWFEDGRMTGYYSLAHKDDQTCELNNLAVLPECRHRKTGHQLLSDAFERAKAEGYTQMVIGIVEENQVLRKWYEGYGFQHTGTEKFDFFPFTCGYMIKNLG